MCYKLLLILTVALGASPRHTLDELVFLNGMSGFGDRGLLDASRTVVSPRSRLGFSLKVVWEDHKGGPHWWSIRTGLPGAPERYDTFEFDLFVEQTDDRATLNVYLYETDDDRWVCWSGRLTSVARGQWHHVVAPRDKMRMWFIGNHKPQWSRVRGLAIEPSRGKAVFYLDAARFRSRSGETLEIFTAEDDGLRPDPTWREPVPAAPKPGGVYFPFDHARLDSEKLLASPARLRELLGPVGVPLSGYGRNLMRVKHALESGGLPTLHYSAFASGYMRYLTRRQAWDVNAKGHSLNFLPVGHANIDRFHGISLAHPAVDAALRHKVDALLRAGLGVWMVVDYVFPWWETLWGYSDAMIAAYRKDLSGEDEGLVVRDGARLQPFHFPDYFRAYNGFYPEPRDLGLASWAEFTPPKPGGKGHMHARRMDMFFYLRSYEWLKLADRIGRYMIQRGGQGLWIVPNPEDTHGSSDYVFLLRCAGVGNLLPEWFGCIGWHAEACYASLPYLREQATRGGTRLSIIQETGAGGHSAPYLDWRVAYSGVYALTAAGQLEDFDNDFIDETPFEVMSDPTKNAYQFKRFRDAVSKALAFLQARKERPRRPGPARILCVAERPPCRACGSIFFDLGQPHSLAVGLSRAHLLFDLRDSFELERVLDRYDVLVCCPWAPRVGDTERIERWLQTRDGRILVTHSFVPTRRADGWWHRNRSTALGCHAWGKQLGLGRIEATQTKEVQITRVADEWRGLFSVGEKLKFPHPLTRCEHGEVLVGTDRGPLVRRVRCGRGWVLYLCYTPGSNVPVTRVDARVMKGLARLASIEPICDADFDAIVQVFHVRGGYSVVAWDAPAMGRWKWRYAPGIAPLRFEAAGVDRTVSLRAKEPGPWVVYDLWADKLTRQAPQQGRVALRMKNTLCALYYAGPDSESMRQTIAAAKRARRRMTELGFERAEM